MYRRLRLLRQCSTRDGRRIPPTPLGVLLGVPVDVSLADAEDWVRDGGAEWSEFEVMTTSFNPAEETTEADPIEDARGQRRQKWLAEQEITEEQFVKEALSQIEDSENALEWPVARYTPETYLDRWPTGPHAELARKILRVDAEPAGIGE